MVWPHTSSVERTTGLEKPPLTLKLYGELAELESTAQLSDRGIEEERRKESSMTTCICMLIFLFEIGQVRAPPTIADKTEVEIGDTLTLTCDGYRLLPPQELCFRELRLAKSRPNYHAFHKPNNSENSGNTFPPMWKFSITNADDPCSAQISLFNDYVEFSDAGIYKCSTTLADSGSLVSGKVLIRVYPRRVDRKTTTKATTTKPIAEIETTTVRSRGRSQHYKLAMTCSIICVALIALS